MAVTLLRRDACVPEPIARRLTTFRPTTDLGALVRDCFQFLPHELAAELLDKISSCIRIESSLAVVHVHGPHSPRFGQRDDYGIVCRHIITTAGVNALASTFNSLTMLNFNFHGLGTSTTAVAIGDTALTAEIPNGTYAVSATRATGTKSASTNVYTTAGTNTLAAGATIQEMGLFSQAATGGGTLWDHFLTGTQTLLTGDGLMTTVTATFAAGG